MDGSITGDNDVQNTLNMKNTGTINFNGENKVVNVNTLSNSGNLNINKNTSIETVDNQILGAGSINVANGTALGLSQSMNTIENTLNLGTTAYDITLLDMTNNSVGALNLSGTNLFGTTQLGIDIDIATQTSDTLQFSNATDLDLTSSNGVEITNINLLNANKAYTEESYPMIKFVSPTYNNQNLIGHINMAWVRIKSDPLNAINIAPGLKFIGNLKNGWQPYAGIQMVWNIMDKTDFRANNVALPDMSVKPYIQYGIGIQKRWGDRFTGFFQTMLRNGGRNGIALSFGFRWALGK